MEGATEYARLFRTGQYGGLYIVSGCHARGETFRIAVLPDGEKAISNGPNNQCVNRDAMEVYGITSGQPGWTETYGWLYKGKWQDDFYKLVEEQKRKRCIARQEKAVRIEKKNTEEAQRINDLLSKY